MPSWRELRDFLRHEGYELSRSSKDEIWVRQNPDGTIDRVRCSKGNGEIYGHLWDRIKKHQLAGITEQKHHLYAWTAGGESKVPISPK